MTLLSRYISKDKAKSKTKRYVLEMIIEPNSAIVLYGIVLSNCYTAYRLPVNFLQPLYYLPAVVSIVITERVSREKQLTVVLILFELSRDAQRSN